MTFHVRLTAKANHDVAEALVWMRERIPQYAVEWDAELDRVIDSLREDPERFPLADGTDSLKRKTRHAIVGRRGMMYRVMFHVGTDTVTILRVLHTSRQSLEP